MSTVIHESVSSSKKDFIVKVFTSQQTPWVTEDLLDTPIIKGSRLQNHPTPVQTAGVTQAVCPATTSLCWAHIFPRGASALLPRDDSAPTQWKTDMNWSQVLQQHHRMGMFLPWLICLEVLWAASQLAMGEDPIFWVIYDRCEIPVAQLVCVSHSLPLLPIPGTSLCLQNMAHAPAVVWEMQTKIQGLCLTLKRIRWEGAEKFQDRQHYQPAALILLEYCLYLCIHCSRAWQGRGVWEKKEMDGWVKDRSSWLSWKQDYVY